ncbi:MAG TPA: glycosyltransferase family 4 protein [Solirubrobacter sp.]|nr:glycosyltransferase family 4 protein [Solirubrobacter sp.]
MAFLTQDLQLSGGVGVIVHHAVQLSRQDFDVDLVLTRDANQPEWEHHGLEGTRIVHLAEARERRYDVAVATWWETIGHVFELPAARHVCFVQSLEDRFYSAGHPLQWSAALALDVPVRFVTEARWIARTLEALRPGERVLYVRNGIPKDLFRPVAEVPVRAPGAPLRILVEGSSRVPFKGVPEALRATVAMTQPRHVTIVSPDGSGAELEGADRVLGPVSQAQLAELYADADVLLKLSRVEGMFGPPLEAFHRGATCVVTPVTGHDEYVAHGENGIVVDWDDTAGTARALDLLARDRALLHRLRHGALATARGWPSWGQQGQVMALALRAVLREPAPDPARAAVRLSRDLAGARFDGERAVDALATANARVAHVENSRAYRTAVRVRTRLDRVTGRRPD